MSVICVCVGIGACVCVCVCVCRCGCVCVRMIVALKYFSLQDFDLGGICFHKERAQIFHHVNVRAELS